MKTKTLLMVAGAGALVYWLWKKNKSELNEPREIGKKDSSKKANEGVALKPLSEVATKEECESHPLGGVWRPEAFCINQPCPRCFPDIKAQLQ